MKHLVRCLGLAAGCVVASAAQAATDGSEPLICALVEITECVPDGGCERVSPQSIGAPRFFRINFAEGQITRTRPEGEEITSPIERTEEVDGKLILQGAEDGIEGEPDGIGWSLSIDQSSGDMVLTGSGDGVAFVIFGACTAF